MLTTTRAPARLSLGLHRSCVRRQTGLLNRQDLAEQRWREGRHRLFTSRAIHRQQAVATASAGGIDVGRHVVARHSPVQRQAKDLPRVCPGCGALSHTIDQESAGYYGPRCAQKALRVTVERAEDAVFEQALQSGLLPAVTDTTAPLSTATDPTPICDRCHYLRYQSRGNSIIHPSMQSIKEIIEESPHKYNHIYHVLDAADFPLSLIPNLSHKLALPRMRSQNRRSRTIEYIRGRQAEVSFIITRADLLAPQKEQVDRMLPQLREVLRDALGRGGHSVRLGNVRCVSAQRGWWTPVVKEEIWSRGGAGWMVGKVNVGKSALFEVVFPKGRKQPDVDIKKLRAKESEEIQDAFMGSENLYAEGQETARLPEPVTESFADSPGDLAERLDEGSIAEDETYQESKLLLGEASAAAHPEQEQAARVDDDTEGSDLLPPARDETAYPDMPLVSSLPGTTASPIRIPFGNGKGELIDLPGIHRSSLDTFVRPEHQKSLVMKSRIKPQQYSIKPGQSILIGGLIRITPKTDDLVFLAYPFVPLDPHLTSTAKAIAIQTGSGEDGEPYGGTVPTISTDEAKQSTESAGTFKLEWDMTKTRAGPLTNKVAGKMKAEKLPFIVYSADLLIEGVGWVELVCQVQNHRRRSGGMSDAFDLAEGKSGVPEVEVFTPRGKFVGVRRPLNAWMIGGPMKVATHARRGRPRMSISYQRRKEGGGQGGVKAVAVEASTVRTTSL